MVAHALREVEGALRQVLTPLAAQQPSETVSATTTEQLRDPGEEPKADKHPDQIKAVLAMLGISQDDELATAWLTLPDRSKGLQRYAHRTGLRPSRPLDGDFQELWIKVESILHGVLDRFEAQYLIIFNSLDALAQKAEPTRQDAQHLASSVPNNLISHARFFDQLVNPKWLPMLRAKGIFKDPPPPEYGDDNGARTVRYPRWPAATYLRKMAAVDPVTVKDILLDVPETNNASVRGALLEIAVALPNAERCALVDRIKSWVHAEVSAFTSEGATEVVTKFLEAGEVAIAVDVSKSVLALYAVPRASTPDVRSKLDEWQYGQFMEKTFWKIAKACPQAALELGSTLLNDFVCLSYPDHLEGESPYRDHSYISRRAIEDHPQNSQHPEIEDQLIRATRDAASEIILSDPAKLGGLVRYFREKRWSVFIRLAMHTVAEAARPDPTVVKDLLLDEALFSGAELWHEYARLLARHFNILDVESKEAFYSWIENAVRIKRTLKDKTGEEAERIKEHWQLELITIIRDHLEPAWTERREALVAKYGEPAHPGFHMFSEEGYRPESVKAAQDLLTMTPDDVINFLKSWEPPASRGLFDATRDGLAHQLSATIQTNPEFFAGKERSFEGLDPTYVRTFIQANEQLARNDRGLNWDSMLELCTWVIDQPRAISGRTGKIRDQDPDWGWARGAINYLLATGVGRDQIPYELRARVWKIIAALANDPDPIVDEGNKEVHEDAYGRATGTVRGYAVQLAIEYGLWVRRQEENAKGAEVRLDAMPELRHELEKRLDDQSTAVRSVYGRFLPWLMLIDKQWVEAQLDRIFPPEPSAHRFHKAVWNAYVLYTTVYSNVFPSLRRQYAAAIGGLAGAPASVSRSRDPQGKLAEHLFMTYRRGGVPLDDPLLLAFWKNAGSDLRGYVIDFIGNTLRNLKKPLEPDAEERLRALWTERYNLAVAAENKTDFGEEMSGFGSWFASGQFDDGWVSQQYLLALEFGSRTTSYHFVANRLVKLLELRPQETLRILGKIIDLKQPNWFVMGSRNEITNILRMALQSSDGPSQTTAREIGNRLVARGNPVYAALLREFPQSSSSLDP